MSKWMFHKRSFMYNILQVREVFLARVQFRVRSDAEAQGRVQRVGRVRQAERRRGGWNNQNSHLFLSLKSDCGKKNCP